MTHVFVLLVTLFFYAGADKEPQAGALIEPSAEQCIADATLIKQKLEASSEVQLVKTACFELKNTDANKN